MKLEAPYPVVTDVLDIPNAILGDTTIPNLSLKQKRSMNNTRYTYVKPTDRHILKFSVIALCMDESDIVSYFITHADHEIRLTKHDGSRYIGYLKSNPLSINYTNDNMFTFDFEFEGVPV